MNIVHLMASPFVGGPERQVLGLARALPVPFRTVFLSFAERGLSKAFLQRAELDGFETVMLRENAPHVFRAAAEIAAQLRHHRAEVLCCNGYKPDLIGWLAARRAGVPVVAIAHGWTAATWKVRVNEALDRLVLHGMDCTVCVSEAQAAKVRRVGVPSSRIRVIRNAVATAPFDEPDPLYRGKLREFFSWRPTAIIGAAGRLSPEKGFEQFIDAAAAGAANTRKRFCAVRRWPVAREAQATHHRERTGRARSSWRAFAMMSNVFSRSLMWLCCRLIRKVCRWPCSRRWRRECRSSRPLSVARRKSSPMARRVGLCGLETSRGWPSVSANF